MRSISKRIILWLTAFVCILATMCGFMTMNVKASEPSDTTNVTTIEKDWYKLNYSKDKFEFLLSASLSDFKNLDSAQLTELVDAFMQAMKTLLYEEILASTKEPDNGGVVTFAATVDDYNDFFNQFSTLKDVKDYVVNRLSDPEEFLKYVSGDYDLIVDYAIDLYINEYKPDDITTEEAYDKIESAMKDVIKEAYSNVSSTDQDKLVTWGITEEGAVNRVEDRVTAIKENGGKVEISFDKIMGAIQTVSVDGNLLFSSNGISMAGVRYLISLIPNPSEIVKMSDADFEKFLSTNVQVSTTFCDLDFEFSIGFIGNVDNIRKAVEKVLEFVDIEIDGNKIKVAIDAPEKVSELIYKFYTSSDISQENKELLFNMTGKKVSEFTSYTYEQMKGFIDEIDYGKVIDSLKDITGNNFDDKLDALKVKIDEFLADSKNYDELIALANKVINYLPDGLKNLTINETYDGDKFVKAGDITFDLEKIGSKLASVLRNRGLDGIADLLDDIKTWLDDTEFTLELDAQVKIPNLYSVSFKVNNSIVSSGFMPAGVGADVVTSLSGVTKVDGKDVQYWVNEATNEVFKTMPSANVVLVPRYETNYAQGDVIKDNNTGVIIEILDGGVIPSDYTLCVKRIDMSESTNYDRILNSLKSNYPDKTFILTDSFEIYFEQNGVRRDVNCKVKISLPIDEKYKDYKSDDVVLVQVGTNNKITLLSATITDGQKVVATVENFGSFGIFVMEDSVPYYQIVVAVVLAGIMTVYLVLLLLLIIKDDVDKKRRLNSKK